MTNWEAPRFGIHSEIVVDVRDLEISTGGWGSGDIHFDGEANTYRLTTRLTLRGPGIVVSIRGSHPDIAEFCQRIGAMEVGL